MAGEMNNEELIQWLKDQGCCYKTALEKLREKGYDRVAFSKISNEELEKLDPTLKKGPLTKLRACRDQLQQSVHENASQLNERVTTGCNGEGTTHAPDAPGNRADSPVRASSPPTGTNGTDAHPVLKKRPSFRQISLLKFTCDGKQKELRLINEITPYWEALARALEISAAKIAIEAKSHVCDPVGAAYAILRQWMSRDPQHCWAKLISALREAADELHVVAHDLERALISQ